MQGLINAILGSNFDRLKSPSQKHDFKTTIEDTRSCEVEYSQVLENCVAKGRKLRKASSSDKNQISFRMGRNRARYHY